jgi:hypothetical protein
MGILVDSITNSTYLNGDLVDSIINNKYQMGIGKDKK